MSETSDSVRILLTTAPPDVAEALARVLVEERLAACVNVLPGVRSVYRWAGAVQNDPESLLVVKSTESRWEALEARLRAEHPYEVPELVAFRPTHVSPPYLDWLQAAVTEPSEGDATSS